MTWPWGGRYGTHCGVVTNATDPTQTGRVEVSIPDVLGAQKLWATVIGATPRERPQLLTGDVVFVEFEAGQHRQATRRRRASGRDVTPDRRSEFFVADGPSANAAHQTQQSVTGASRSYRAPAGWKSGGAWPYGSVVAHLLRR